MSSFRDRFKDYQLQWLAWTIILLATLAISLFFGVNYPVPEQPDQPPEPVELGAHFANPVDITGSGSASAPALTFNGDTNTGFYHEQANRIAYTADGSKRLSFAETHLLMPNTAISMSVDSDNYANENIALPTVSSRAIISSTDGALWSIADGEVWIVHAVFCNVTTNFDCTGDDCNVHIGDGNDADGLLDLDDGELQTTDTEGTGAPAGWQGFMSSDTRGAYLAQGLGFVYAPSGAAESIDITIEDNSDSSDPTAGAGTCYLVYTRFQ